MRAYLASCEEASVPRRLLCDLSEEALATAALQVSLAFEKLPQTFWATRGIIEYYYMPLS